MTNGRYDIALLISGIENEFSYSVCKGVAELAEKQDFNLYIFPGDNFQTSISSISDTLINSQHSTIFAYANEKLFDAAIISYSTIFRDQNSFVATDICRRFSDIPVVTLCLERDGCGCVRYEGVTGMTMMVEHLIKEHGCRRIAFVTGALTNLDSQERFAAYKAALEQNGIAYDPQLVANGDFIYDSCKQVEAMLDSLETPPDAICCANDHIAADVYRLMHERGSAIGRDIYVVGYDNLNLSSALTPALTTVNASPSNLGIHAAQLALEMIKTRTPRTITLTSTLLIRDSCGTHISSHSECCCGDSDLLFENSPILKILGGKLREFVDDVIGFAEKDHASDGEIEKLTLRFKSIMRGRIPDALSAADLCDLIREVKVCAEKRCVTQLHRKELYELFSELFCEISHALTSLYYYAHTSNRNSIGSFNDLMSLSGSDYDSALSDIALEISRQGALCSYIYLTDSPVAISDPEIARPFDRLMLKAYHYYSDSHALSGSRIFKRGELFSNRYVNRKHRVTLMIMPLFTMNEQQGVVIFDMPVSFLSNVVKISRQISSSLEAMSILSAMHNHIEAVESSNSILSTIASRDTLTGLYNRLGFFDHSEFICRNPSNFGRSALVAFVDMDNLKLTNDTFGHDEGDYALQLVNNVLTDVFKSGICDDSVIGRIGGDEFAVFAIIRDGLTEAELRHRLAHSLDEHNDDSGKPYIVSMSVGFASFTCSETVTIRTLLEQADARLYEHKPLKPRSIFKTSY